MQAPVPHTINNQHLWLSAERCLFWEEEKALIISDLHVGKTGHFRKAGIAVPPSVFKEDLQRLVTLLHYFKPHKVIAVGDLFHSKENKELEMFQRWRDEFDSLPFHLVKGNHDILKESWYAQLGITVWDPTLTLPPFLFSHDKCDIPTDQYAICGHVHPGVVINGMGRQTLRFPCFYFSHTHCILPAFSRFTGTYTIEPKRGDTVYAIVQNSLIKM